MEAASDPLYREVLDFQLDQRLGIAPPGHELEPKIKEALRFVHLENERLDRENDKARRMFEDMKAATHGTHFRY